MTTVATTVFTPPILNDDVRVPLSVTLDPGDYALIFGSDDFGASGGFAVMAGNNLDIPGSASYVRWDWFFTPPQWYDASIEFEGVVRFVVTGRVIPEPSGVALFWLGSLGACGFYRRHRNTTSH
jgi:hypothetical protein